MQFSVFGDVQYHIPPLPIHPFSCCMGHFYMHQKESSYMYVRNVMFVPFMGHYIHVARKKIPHSKQVKWLRRRRWDTWDGRCLKNPWFFLPEDMMRRSYELLNMFGQKSEFFRIEHVWLVVGPAL